MSIFKCKMCGANLEVVNGASVATCDYCGASQTLPRLNDEHRANLYDRAGHFRRLNEFDKAASIYEQILSEDASDAEAYWSLVLCRFGIEYVEDPSSGKRVPTIHRSQFTSIFGDEDYKAAIEKADDLQREVYESEAKAIDDIHKGILAISQKEKPFDVFICYKETDEKGERTHDSVLANDLYHQLVTEGFNVFFARITLESKLGSAYEPYIFAALNSAKVMVVLGTKPEYFEAVWVRNEWSRFLALTKNDPGRMLIPAYKDMDPYDLPREFAHLQAQDMSKLGFMQDLIRGIKKILHKDEPTVHEATVVGGTNLTVLLKRAFIFAEDGDYKRADENCEQVLDVDPENADAYLIKLLMSQKVKRRENLANVAEPFDGDPNYEKACRYGTHELRAELEGYNKHIRERNALQEKVSLYESTCKRMKEAKTESAYKTIAGTFKRLGDFRDSAKLSEECEQLAEDARRDVIYDKAYVLFESDDPDKLTEASEIFGEVPGWRDADDLKHKAQAKREKILADRAAALAAEKRRKKIRMIVRLSVIGAIALAVSITLLITLVINPANRYKKAEKYLESEEYLEAYRAFLDMGDYKDSADRADSIRDEHPGVALPGESVEFGAFRKNEDGGAEKEALEWIVLSNEDGELLLITRDVIFAKEYNEGGKAAYWSNCSLRKWLNNTFINNAFTEEEKGHIILTENANPDNPEHVNQKGENIDGGKDTSDSVFLLSCEEYEKYAYLLNGSAAAATDFAESKGAVNVEGAGSVWWLRTPGYTNSYGACVSENGYVSYYGSAVDHVRGVRAVIRIDAEALEE